jgi:glycosyltransferase involved in cell wall biosynthesis
MSDTTTMSTGESATRRLHIAMIGTRGVPAAYGGFETAIEEIGRRLVERGHAVTVYCRSKDGEKPAEHLGMSLVHLPALHVKVAETLSHTGLSAIHAVTHTAPDAAFVFNAANAPFVPVLRARGIPTAVHVDGLEWKRDKWGGAGKRYYRAAESAAVRWSDALIADAQGIADYYDDEFGVPTELISYGATIIDEPTSTRIAELGLVPSGFHLVVARFEPENHVREIVEGYAASDASLPLVVVGSAPYSAEYTAAIERIAASDDRIRMLGGVWDQDLLDELYANALTYVHGHSVGGTNPSLLRAIGAGTAVLAWDVDFNREVTLEDGRYFGSAAELAPLLESSESDAASTLSRGDRLRVRAATTYDWDLVTTGYERLAARLAAGYSIRPIAKSARRSASSARSGAPVAAPVS